MLTSVAFVASASQIGPQASMQTAETTTEGCPAHHESKMTEAASGSQTAHASEHGCEHCFSDVCQCGSGCMMMGHVFVLSSKPALVAQWDFFYLLSEHIVSLHSGIPERLLRPPRFLA
ncbi:hypothetical protein [Thiomicrospira sp. WB1]|uniref:hypothetical protein n=1 Tax=Thiomicrospira sp. WB1 TaxID=1685380 RepID=UPI00128FABA4|nr:hypothetical protein [Thiomicrospira sp. WB1]